MSDQIPPSITAFRALFERHLPEIDGWLADDIELRPPTYAKAWRGKDLVRRLLVFAAQELGGLTYTDCWRNGDRYALRFDGMIDGKDFSGVDIVALGDDGRIVMIEILARPPTAMLMLRERMGAHVRADPTAARLMGLSP